MDFEGIPQSKYDFRLMRNVKLEGGNDSGLAALKYESDAILELYKATGAPTLVQYYARQAMLTMMKEMGSRDVDDDLLVLEKDIVSSLESNMDMMTHTDAKSMGLLWVMQALQGSRHDALRQRLAEKVMYLNKYSPEEIWGRLIDTTMGFISNGASPDLDSDDYEEVLERNCQAFYTASREMAIQLHQPELAAFYQRDLPESPWF